MAPGPENIPEALSGFRLPPGPGCTREPGVLVSRVFPEPGYGHGAGHIRVLDEREPRYTLVPGPAVLCRVLKGPMFIGDPPFRD